MKQRELKSMSNKELANIMIDYYDRIINLIDKACLYKDNKNTDKDGILREYKDLKESIRKDSHYVSLLRNQTNNNIVYSVFSQSISEAAAYGLLKPTNSPINQKFIDTLLESRYKLTKHYSRNKWGELAK